MSSAETRDGVVPSIGFLVGVAIGGRATLLGPVLGSIAVAWAQTSLSEQFPSAWTYAQGALFILVVAFLPGGLASLAGLRATVRGRRGLAVGDGASGRGTAAEVVAPDAPAPHPSDPPHAPEPAGRTS